LDGITVFATSLPSQGPAAPDAAGAPEAAGLEDAVEADGLEVELVDEQPVSANAVQAARIPNERRLSTAFPSLTGRPDRLDRRRHFSSRLPAGSGHVSVPAFVAKAPRT
jgi:hypothetical protein